MTASRGDLTVTVGGVGQIVPAGESTQQQPATSAGGAAPAVPQGLSVFPRTSGQVTGLLVHTGQHVVVGQPLALLDDGGVAAAAIAQARIDLDVARLETRQKRTHDPLRGSPPTAAELAAGRSAVTAAGARLARLLSGPRPADVSTARLEVKRAQADLETLLGGTPEARAEALLVARQNVELATSRLDRILAPPNSAEVATARADVSKAEADLEALVRSDRTQPVTQTEIDAAKAAIEAARQRLARVLAPADPADVAAARLEVTRAESELRRLEAGPSSTALGAARHAVEAANVRLRQLLSPPFKSDVSSARFDVLRARADLAALRARRSPASETDIQLSVLKAEGARARLDAALNTAGPLTIRAPQAGTVTALLTAPGAHVDPVSPVAAIADLARLEAKVDLSEYDIAQVKQGQSATLSVDALGGRSFGGEVLSTALVGTNTSGVVTFPVLVGLTNPSGLKPGMNVSVRIVVAQAKNVVQVPLEAVSQDGAEATVLVPDATGKPVSRVVTLGLANNKSVEILKGLHAGEAVIIEAASSGA